MLSFLSKKNPFKSSIKKLQNKLSITKEEENILHEIYQEYYGINPEITEKHHKKEFPLKDYYQEYLSSNEKQEYSLYIFNDPITTKNDFDKLVGININPCVDDLSPYLYNDFMNTLITIRKENKPNKGKPYIKYPIFFSGKIDSYVSEVIDRLNNLTLDLRNINKKLNKLKIILKKLIKGNSGLLSSMNELSDKNYKSLFNKLRKKNKTFIESKKNINSLESELNQNITNSYISINKLLNINELHNKFNNFDDLYIKKLIELVKNIETIIMETGKSLNNIYNNKSKISYNIIIKYFKRLIGQKLNKSIQLSNFNEISKLENRLIYTKQNMNKSLKSISNKQKERSILINNIKESSQNNFNERKREIIKITIIIENLKKTFQQVYSSVKRVNINNILKRLIRLREKLGLPHVLENSELPETYKFEETNNNKYVSEILKYNSQNRSQNITPNEHKIINNGNTLKNINQIGYLTKYNGLFDVIYNKLTSKDINKILSITSISDKYKYLVSKKYLHESIYKYIKHTFLLIPQSVRSIKSIFSFSKKISNISPEIYDKMIKNTNSLILQQGGFIGLEISLLSATSVIAIIMICMNIFYKIINAYITYLYNRCSDKSITRLKSIKMYVSSEFRHYLIAFLLFMIEFMVGSIFFFIPPILIITILKYYSDFIIYIYKKKTNTSKSKIYRIFESLYLSSGPYYYRYLNSNEYKNEQEKLKNVPYTKQIKNSINIEIRKFSNTLHCIIPIIKKSSENEIVLRDFNKNTQLIYQLVYDLGFLDDNEIIRNIKINLLEELKKSKINLLSMVENQISKLGDSINEDEKNLYRKIASSSNSDLITLLPLFQYIFFVQLLDPFGNYTDKKIYGIIVIDRLFANKVFIKYNNDMVKKQNNIKSDNTLLTSEKINKIIEKCNVDNKNNKNSIKSFLNFLLLYFGLLKK